MQNVNAGLYSAYWFAFVAVTVCMHVEASSTEFQIKIKLILARLLPESLLQAPTTPEPFHSPTHMHANTTEEEDSERWR